MRWLLLACMLAATVWAQEPDVSSKKGFGRTIRVNEPWYDHVESVNVAWHYSWGGSPPTVPPTNGREWVPMRWGRNPWEVADLQYILRSASNGAVTAALGFNEPDKTDQSNMTVAEAVALWPDLELLGLPLGSPAPANANGSWLAEFMTEADNNGLRVDFLCVHHYGGPSADALISKLESLHDQYGLPIWITEFAVADWNATTVEENRYSPAQVLAFMQEVLPRLEALDYVQRYSWFSTINDQNRPQLCSSALFKVADGSLTPLGEFYANFRGGKYRAVTEAQGWTTTDAEMLLTEWDGAVHGRDVAVETPPTEPIAWRAEGAINATATLPPDHNTWYRVANAGTVKLCLDIARHDDGWLPAVNRMYQDPPYVGGSYAATGNFLSELGEADWSLAPAASIMSDDGASADAVAGDGVWTTRLTIPVPGVYEYAVIVDGNTNQRIGGLGASGEDADNTASFIIEFPGQIVTIEVDTTWNCVRATPRAADITGFMAALAGPGVLLGGLDDGSAQDLANQFDFDNDADVDLRDFMAFCNYQQLARAANAVVNGGFEEGEQSDGNPFYKYTELTGWDNGADNQSAVGARNDFPASGEYRGMVSWGQQPRQVTEHVLAFGDKVIVSCSIAGAYRWDADDTVSVRIFYVDEQGGDVTLGEFSADPPEDNVYDAFVFEFPPIDNPSAIQRPLGVAFVSEADASDEWASLDDVSVLVIPGAE